MEGKAQGRRCIIEGDGRPNVRKDHGSKEVRKAGKNQGIGLEQRGD